MCKNIEKFLKKVNDNYSNLIIAIFTLFLIIVAFQQCNISERQTEIMEEIKVSNKADLVISSLGSDNIIERSIYVEGGTDLQLVILNKGNIPTGDIRYWYGSDDDFALYDNIKIENLDPIKFNKTKIKMRKNCKNDLKKCGIDLGRIYNFKINYHCDLCKPQDGYQHIFLCFYEKGIYSYEDCNKKLNP